MLDNCEQVLASAPAIAALLAACPALQVLATSRAPLRVRGERQVPISPLSVPFPETPVEGLAQSDAVRLFLDRARSTYPALDAMPDNLRAIAEICRHLDGLPLAIELAAARTALLPPTALLDRLSDCLRLLTDGPRDLPERQRTMADAIAWSYNLLDAEEQALFRRLTVFVGGFDLEAAIAVADATPADVLDRIGALVEHSLLRRMEGDGTDARFVLLETVREFAWMQLQEHGESDAIRGLHAAYFLSLAEHIETVLYGSEMRHHLARFEAEYPNCLAALGYFVEVGDATRELRLAGMLSEYWYYRGQLSEGIAALRGALVRGADAPTGPLARAMSELSFLLWSAGEARQALPLLAASVPLARQTGDVYRMSQVQYMWAVVLHYEEGRDVEAIALLEDVVELIASHQPPLELYPSALIDLGELWLLQGDRERGVALLHQALTISQDWAIPLHVAQAHLRLGRLARREGATRRAADHDGRSLRAYRESGVVTHAGLPLVELGALAAASGYPRLPPGSPA
jgi:predicted ATPase